MWESNKQNGVYHPHAVEVVDIETGQVRYIQSGARIKFVDGLLSEARDQATYNELSAIPTAEKGLPPPVGQ